MRRAWCGLLLVLLAGCNRQDTEALTRIAKKVQVRAEAVTGDVKNSAANSWQGVGEFGIEGRVAARLRWDRSLADAKIEVSANGAIVELKGSVRDAAQKRRALDLAESTEGVDRVSDNLELAAHDP